MSETRVYLGDDDTWDMASNCTVKVLDAGGYVCFEIDVETLMSRCGTAMLFPCTWEVSDGGKEAS